MAELHAERLPHGFFVRLGPRYLRSYHRTFIGHDSAVALVADRGGYVTGFLVGAVDVKDHRHFVVRRHAWRLAAIGLAALATRPPLAVEFTRTRLGRYIRGLARALRRAPSPQTGAAPRPEAPRTAVLTHVAVDSQAAGRGTGSALVGSFVDAARREGADRIELVTLAGPAGAGEFYRRLGWRQSSERASAGSQFLRFFLDLR